MGRWTGSLCPPACPDSTIHINRQGQQGCGGLYILGVESFGEAHNGQADNGSLLKLYMEQGMSVAEAANRAGIARSWAYKLLARERRAAAGPYIAADHDATDLSDEEIEYGPEPRGKDELAKAARRAQRDFGYFCRRYFGRIDTPWRTIAAVRALELLASPEKEFLVVNCPPGVGKSTLFTHDIPAWLICRDRSIRILIGSRTQTQAERLLGRLRNSLKSRYLLMPSERDLRRGLAVKPTGILVDDFGRFRSPDRTAQWSRQALAVEQVGGGRSTEKEMTVAAYGFDGDYLGLRPDVSVWDDLVDRKNVANPEVLAATVDLYESQAESRIEPGGLHMLEGQRLRARDLYRHALDLTTQDDEDDSDDDDPASSALRRWWGRAGSPIVEQGAVRLADDYIVGQEPLTTNGAESTATGRFKALEDDRTGYKYHHIIFPAHFEDRCRGYHRKDAPPALSDDPHGCLLDPARLTWKELRTIQENNTDRYRITYQQEDVDPAHQLVPDIWVRGGIGDDGVLYDGCFDYDRSMLQLPTLPPGTPFHMVITADPSPTRFWAVQMWCWVPATRTMHLMNIYSGQLEAPGLLDWNHDRSTYSGLLERWHTQAGELGYPPRTLIFEINAAQRFLTQYDHFRRWRRDRSVNLVPHTTGLNKTDADKGVYALQSEWRHARVRLPAQTPEDRRALLPLIDEVTRYPDGTATDDQVMAQWFLLWNAERLWSAGINKPTTQRRPSWLESTSRARLRIAR